MIYLTYNDSPSGIYNSQVIDVVAYLQKGAKAPIKLVALISIRNYFSHRRLIKSRLQNSIVLPMVPKVSMWKWNVVWIFFIMLFSKKKTIIARGPFATNLALHLKAIGLAKKVIFDARGAYEAELTEYNVIENNSIVSKIRELESRALFKSDYRLAVSNALVDYWKSNYNYTLNNHVVIPCTLSDDFVEAFPSEEWIRSQKQALGFSEHDNVVIYSGSSSGWQSFQLIDDLLFNWMKINSDIKLLVLSNHFTGDYKVLKHYKERVIVKWVKPKEVRKYLLIGNYGILCRENTVTNKVASPVKYAEYLAAGLHVIISENIGDYTKFTTEHGVGFVYKSDSDLMLPKLAYAEKKRVNTIANSYFLKKHYLNSYKELINC